MNLQKFTFTENQTLEPYSIKVGVPYTCVNIEAFKGRAGLNYK